MRNLEHEEQVFLFRWVENMKPWHPAFSVIFAIPNGGHRHISVAKKLKAEGVKRGIPDVFMAYPSTNKHGLFIEMKSEKGVISLEQRAMALNFMSFDYEHHFCYSWIEAAQTICDYLGIDRGKAGVK